MCFNDCERLESGGRAAWVVPLEDGGEVAVGRAAGRGGPLGRKAEPRGGREDGVERRRRAPLLSPSQPLSTSDQREGRKAGGWPYGGARLRLRLRRLEWRGSGRWGVGVGGRGGGGGGGRGRDLGWARVPAVRRDGRGSVAQAIALSGPPSRVKRNGRELEGKERGRRRRGGRDCRRRCASRWCSSG